MNLVVVQKLQPGLFYVMKDGKQSGRIQLIEGKWHLSIYGSEGKGVPSPLTYPTLKKAKAAAQIILIFGYEALKASAFDMF